MFCREQAAHYHAERDNFERLGIGIAAVGSGTADMARDFVEQFNIGFDVFTDPSKRAFQVAGMRHRAGIRPKTLGYAWRALKSGHYQGRIKGDPLQQGGVMVIDRDGEVRFSHVEDGPGEHLAAKEVLATVGRIRDAAGG